jgi:hypothetical protein
MTNDTPFCPDCHGSLTQEAAGAYRCPSGRGTFTAADLDATSAYRQAYSDGDLAAQRIRREAEQAASGPRTVTLTLTLSDPEQARRAILRARGDDEADPTPLVDLLAADVEATLEFIGVDLDAFGAMAHWAGPPAE